LGQPGPLGQPELLGQSPLGQTYEGWRGDGGDGFTLAPNRIEPSEAAEMAAARRRAAAAGGAGDPAARQPSPPQGKVHSFYYGDPLFEAGAHTGSYFRSI
jgi:hypothetical protein